MQILSPVKVGKLTLLLIPSKSRLMLSCFATAVRGEVVLQLAQNEREKLRRSRGKVPKEYGYSFVYMRGLRDYVPR